MSKKMSRVRQADHVFSGGNVAIARRFVQGTDAAISTLSCVAGPMRNADIAASPQNDGAPRNDDTPAEHIRSGGFRASTASMFAA